MFKSLEVQLIAQVRKYEDLYDNRRRDFKLKEQHWQQVGDVLGISAITAMRKWTTLKNRYLRVRKGPNPSKEWQFYNYLRFLDPIYSPEYERERKEEDRRKQEQIRKTILSYTPRLQEIPKNTQQKIFVSSEPCLEKIPEGIRKTIRSYNPCPPKIPKQIQKTITSSEPLVIINENNCGLELKSYNDEMCDYELKLSNEDNYTYELKINPVDTCRNGLDNIQNRIYELNKISKARKVYGKHNEDDCESFAEFVAAKLRTLKTDAERNAMKQRVLQAINYLPEEPDDGILDIVFVEDEETED